MRKPLMYSLALLLGMSSLWGCGSSGGGGDTDYQAAGERLAVVSVTPVTKDEFVIDVVTETNDFGPDNNKDVVDEGQNNGLPDDGEEVLQDVVDFYAKITLTNKPRLQEGQSTDLIVTTVDVTYVDANGDVRFKVNRQYATGDVMIAPDSTADITINLFPKAIINQTSPAGPGEIFWTKNNSLIDPIRNMTAILDIYAHDERNDDNQVHIQRRVAIALQNPMEH